MEFSSTGLFVGSFYEADITPHLHQFFDDEIVLFITTGSIPTKENDPLYFSCLKETDEGEEFWSQYSVLNSPIGSNDEFFLLFEGGVALVDDAIRAKAGYRQSCGEGGLGTAVLGVLKIALEDGFQEWSYDEDDKQTLKRSAEQAMADLQARFEKAGIRRKWKLTDMVFEVDFSQRKVIGITPVDWERTEIVATE